MSDSVRPHRWQPTRLLRPWDSSGKSNGVGCHFLLQCVKVKVKPLSRVQLLATPWTVAHQPPPSMGFSRQILEWGAIAFSAIQVHRCAKHRGILFKGSTRVWPIYKDKQRSERQKIPDIIYSGQMGSCQDASRGSMGVSEDCLLNWELFELFCFLYFTYF